MLYEAAIWLIYSSFFMALIPISIYVGEKLEQKQADKVKVKAKIVRKSRVKEAYYNKAA